MIPYKIKIDIDGQRDITSNVTLSVGDVNGYGLVLEFCREGKPYDITGYNLSVHAMPSGATLPIPDIGTVEGGRGYYIIKPSMYAYAGETKLEVILSDDSGSTVTKVLHFPVRSGFSSFGGSVVDEKDYTVLQTLIQQAQAAISQAAAALATAEAGNALARRLSGGEGELSLVTPDLAKALGDYAIAFGNGSVSGIKAFYIKSVDFENQKIYLTKEQVATPKVSLVDNTDADFETPAYAEGDVFSVVSSGHFPFCGVIASVTNNVITWSSIDSYFKRRGLGGVASLFSVPAKPEIGSVILGNNSVSFGKDTTAAGESAFAGGEGNTVGGDYGVGFGKGNKVGAGTAGFGLYNELSGQWNIGGGSSNKSDLSTRGSVICGSENAVKGSAYGVYTGVRNNAIDSSYTMLTGQNAKILSALFSVLALNGGSVSGQYNILAGTENTVDATSVIATGEKNSITDAIYGLLIGFRCNMEGEYNNVLGHHNDVSGQFNTAIGESLTVNGNFNSLRGSYLSCEGNYNDIQGKSCHTTGDCNFVRGDFLLASGNQTVLGQFNAEDPDKIFIIGGGTGSVSSSRRNIFTIDRKGNVTFDTKIGDIETALDSIIAMQNELIGGDSV